MFKGEVNKYYTFWVCFCSFRYPACNARAQYCQLWPIQLYNNFSHITSQRARFSKKKFIEHNMYILIWSTTFARKISDSKKNSARYDQICILVFMQSNRCSCPTLMKRDYSGQIFVKYWNIKFHKNPSSGSRVPCEQTDKHDEANSFLSQFCEGAYKLMNQCYP
jgi:hypothetical protein